MILTQITPWQIQNEPVPIKELLKDSLYYPSAGFDGGVVNFFSKQVQSFVFCDYGFHEREFLDKMDGFRGYKVLANRKLDPNDLTPNGWKMQIPPGVDPQAYTKYIDPGKKPFAHWVVYDRDQQFDENHGPKRFSLLYIGGEGVATYQALYWSNKETAKILAIIQPGTGFGMNWTDFRKKNGHLAWVIMENQHGTPKTILFGGIGNEYEEMFDWDGYKMTGKIEGYYHREKKYGGGRSGEVTVWEKK